MNLREKVLRNDERLLKVAVDFGTILLGSGAEIYRVEESMQRILKAYGIEEAEVFAIPHLILTTIVTPDKRTITRSKRVYFRDSNFDRISAANDLVRQVCATTPPLNDVFEQLSILRKRPIYSTATRVVFSALTGLSFTLLFQGNLLDGFVTAFAIIISRMICVQMERFHANSFFVTIIASFIHTLIAYAMLSIFPSLQVDRVIMGTLMILVPGVAFTTALRDIIAKDLLAGIIEGMEALLVATAIAIGSTLGFLVMNQVWGVFV